MPFFGRHSTEKSSPPQTTEEEHQKRHSSLFRNRTDSPSHSPAAGSSNSTSGSVNGRHNVLSRHNEDPSIGAARERVFAAEAAEREADKALAAARNAVKEAREQVKRLEREAAEEARLAKIKQTQAKSISDRAKPLGRHEHV